MARWGFVLWCLLLGVLGCSRSQTVEGPLVRVDGEDITLLDVREYRSKLPKYLRPNSTGEKEIRDLLRSLVLTKVMLLEARAQHLDEDPEVLARVRKVVADELVARMRKLEIQPRAHITEEEMQRRFHEDHWDEVHRPAHILCASKKDAEQIVEELRNGADFAQLAREKSLAKRDARHGGDLGRYFGPGDVVPELGDAVLGLKAGQITDPVRTRDGWEVVKILDVKKVPFEAVQGRLARALTRKKMHEARLEYVKELEKKYQVHYVSAGIRALMRPQGREETPHAPLVRTSQGVIEVGAPGVRKALIGIPRSLLGDSTAVVAVLRNKLMADSLMVYEARSRGLDQSADMKKLRRQALERIMLQALRRKEVLNKVEITPEQIRKTYEKYKDEYELPPLITVREILVDSLSQANDLRARILAGESMADLAWEFSKRAGARGAEGKWVLNPTSSEGWEDLMEQFKSAPLGKLMGPVKVAQGYSIFRVEKRQPARVRTLKEADPLVRYRIRQHQIQDLYNQFTQELMDKYSDQITWFDDRIEAAARNWKS